MIDPWITNVLVSAFIATVIHWQIVHATRKP